MATYYISPTGSDSTGTGTSGNPWASLSKAFGSMVAGDTVYLNDGTYTGTLNQMNSFNRPPSGTSAAVMTQIRAINQGRVILNGQGARSMLDFEGSSSPTWIVLYGIQFVNNGSTWHQLDGSSDTNRAMQHWLVSYCGFQNQLYVAYASYITVEDCYATGVGRAVFITFVSDHIIFRRCVARIDNGNGGGMPITSFFNYCGQYVEFQNVIAIDSDDNYYSNYEGTYGGFYTRNTVTVNGHDYSSTHTHFTGSIILNVKHSISGVSSPSETWSIGSGSDDTQLLNVIMWDMRNAFVPDSGFSGTTITVNHSTFGVTTATTGLATNMLQGLSPVGDSSNSIFYSIAGTAINGYNTSATNDFYGNGTDRASVTTTTGTLTVNPLTASLKYLPRIESGSPLKGVGTDGGDVGANVLTKIGTDGTFHGDTGYDTDTGNALWPWPNESTIKSFFIDYGTGSGSPPSKRGFTADGNGLYGGPITLTSYIWEYLGNATPPFIYGTSNESLTGRYRIT